MKKTILFFSFFSLCAGLTQLNAADDATFKDLSMQLRQAVDGWDLEAVWDLVQKGASPCFKDKKGRDALARYFAPSYSDEETESSDEDECEDQECFCESDDQKELIKILIEQGVSFQQHMKHKTVQKAVEELKAQALRENVRLRELGMRSRKPLGARGQRKRKVISNILAEQN